MNNKMTINEIYNVVADIHNSIYNLRKNEKITFEDYENISDVCTQMERSIRYAISNNIALDKFFAERSK